MNKEAKKNKRNMPATRSGVMLIALLAVLILVINLITASYSWFTPQEDTKQGLKYDFSGKIRSEYCTMSTYEGIKLDGSDASHTPASGEYLNQIRYGNSPTSGSKTVAAGKTRYFKTEIINADTKNASDISLYLSTISGKFTIAVTYPGNTVRKFSSTPTNNMYIVRDAYVKKHDSADVNGPGKLEIEWFVTAETSTSFSINNLYLLYN